MDTTRLNARAVPIAGALLGHLSAVLAVFIDSELVNMSLACRMAQLSMPLLERTLLRSLLAVRILGALSLHDDIELSRQTSQPDCRPTIFMTGGVSRGFIGALTASNTTTF